MKDSSFILGPWRVEPQRHRLVGKGETRRVTPKTMDVLLCLVAGAKDDGAGDPSSSVVTREALLAAVWSGTHVGEEVLTRGISDLRAALGDDPRTPRFVETIPKVGYRLVTPVEQVAVAPAASAPAGPAGRAPTTVRVIIALLVAVAAAGWLARSRLADSPRPPTAGPLAATPLTTLPGFESFAELSPDGRQVAFSHRPSDDAAIDLYVMPSSGGPPRRLTAGPTFDLGPAWSPDSRRIAFLRLSNGDERCAIMEIPAAGGPERRLGSCGNNVSADLAWSPSGAWLAFSDRERDEPFGIYLLSTFDGTRRKLVAPDGEHWGDSEPVFSPDGRQIAFTRSVSMATQDVYRVAVGEAGAGRAAEPARVTHDGRSIRGHAWTADGTALLVSSRRTGARGLWRFPLDGGAPAWLPLAVDHAWRPTLGRRPDGPLVFERRDLESSILHLRLGDNDMAAEAPAEPVIWMETTAEDLDPRHAPDAPRVAFASNRSGTFEIWTARADGTEPEQHTALGGSFTGSPQWSPDGTIIVFDARLDGHADIYRLLLDGAPEGGARVERLTTHPANDLAPSFAADGAFVYFGSNRTGRWQIWRLPAGATEAVGSTPGAAEQITFEGGYRSLATADGTALVHTRYGADGLFRHDLAAGTSTPVAGTATLLGGSHWTLQGDTLYWLAVPDGEQAAVLMRLRPGGVPEHLQRLAPVSLMSGFSIAADERSFLVAAISRLESDLWRVAPGKDGF